MKASSRSVVAGMLLFSAMPFMAQGQGQQSQQQQKPQQQSQQPSSQQQQQSEKSQQELKVSEQEMKQQVTDANKASKLIGMTVKNEQGEDLGKIKDLVVDLQSGRIAYVVLASGGTMGFGQKMVAIPIQALTVQAGEKALLLNLSKQRLAQAPGFKEQNWPNLNAAEKGQTIGLAQPPAGGGGQSQAAGGAGSQSQTATGGGASQPQAAGDTNSRSQAAGGTNTQSQTDGDTNSQPQATGGTNSQSPSTGGTGSQSQQSSGQEASSQESITSLQQLTAAQDPSSLEGKQAKISNAQVQEVIGKDTLTVSSKGSKQQLLVKSQEPVENIKPGQTVSISGKIQSMPSDVSQLGIDPDAAKKIEGQKVYLQATQVKPSE